MSYDYYKHMKKGLVTYVVFSFALWISKKNSLSCIFAFVYLFFLTFALFHIFKNQKSITQYNFYCI